MRFFLALLTVVCISAFWGCGSGEPGEGDFPAPGAMRVVSIERISLSGPSLFPDGSFRDWPEKGVLKSFHSPDPKASSIARESNGKEGFSVAQKFLQPATDAQKQFGALVPLKPKTKYRLEVTASSPDSARADVVVYDAKDGKANKALANPLLQIAASEKLYTCSGVFQTEDLPDVLIETRLSKEAKAPATMVWHNWSVYAEK